MISIAEMMKKHEETGGKFPVGMGEVIATPSDAAAIDAARVELRRVAMVLHSEARAVLQNVFLCPADVEDALDHLSTAYHTIEDSMRSPKITAALNTIPK